MYIAVLASRSRKIGRFDFSIIAQSIYVLIIPELSFGTDSCGSKMPVLQSQDTIADLMCLKRLKLTKLQESMAILPLITRLNFIKKRVYRHIPRLSFQ